MKDPEIVCVTQYVEPTPVAMTYNGVTFEISGALATFYRWFEYLGELDKFVTDAKPYWWRYYRKAVDLKQAEEDRKAEVHESYLRNLNAKKSDRRRQKRMEMKNGISRQENAVQAL